MKLYSISPSSARLGTLEKYEFSQLHDETTATTSVAPITDTSSSSSRPATHQLPCTVPVLSVHQVTNPESSSLLELLEGVPNHLRFPQGPDGQGSCGLGSLSSRPTIVRQASRLSSIRPTDSAIPQGPEPCRPPSYLRTLKGQIVRDSALLEVHFLALQHGDRVQSHCTLTPLCQRS